MTTLRDQLIRLGSVRKELRPHIRILLAKVANQDFLYQVTTEDGIEYYESERDLTRAYRQIGVHDSPYRHRPELEGQPKLEGLSGPMWNGIRGGRGVIRYESSGKYRALSSSRMVATGLSKVAAGESLFETIQEFCNELAKVSQKILRRETAVIAHRPGSSCEAHVTHKAERTRYRICYGVDATDVDNVKVVIQFKQGDDMMEELDLPGAMEPTDVAEEACDRLLELIGLGRAKAASWSKVKKTSDLVSAEEKIDQFFKNWGYAKTPSEGFAQWAEDYAMETIDALATYSMRGLIDDVLYALKQDRYGLSEGVTAQDVKEWLRDNRKELIHQLEYFALF